MDTCHVTSMDEKYKSISQYLVILIENWNAMCCIILRVYLDSDLLILIIKKSRLGKAYKLKFIAASEHNICKVQKNHQQHVQLQEI